ncbi:MULTISPECIES: phosphotransferase [unclassified Sinorhizobium]|uniref:phosphotransferase n=1 Tax=unclassified Sinorhizobium TaxID=2613772 RepID=UPI0024C45A29|nr:MULTISPECIES: phosphotransferase [unclassified Sinorhizobium]MDK1373528.1 phosphotransferase [Sinorhizobium sp. 6-70]MDK1482787.1 phosphotransferase [Sinorhizobium sp. 6-117]
MTKETDATPLTGGERTAVSRRGEVVIRETGPWACSVHSLLRHLEDAGFAGAPRVVGDGFDEKGREVLTYVEGDVISPAPWSDEAIHALGELVRRLHDATASFRPPADALWRPWFGRMVGTPDIIGHCDAAPWNVVSRDRKPVALIDWEAAGPVDRLTEIAMAAWNNAQLYDDDVAEMNALPDAGHRMQQVRLFADGYGLPADARHRLGYRIIELAAESAANEVVEQQITLGTEIAPRVWGIAWQTRSVAWLIRNRDALEKALQ